MQYELIGRNDEQQLSHTINIRLEEGWKLFGYPFSGEGQTVFQAITKEDEKFPYDTNYFLNKDQMEALEKYSKKIRMTADRICIENIRKMVDSIIDSKLYL